MTLSSGYLDDSVLVHIVRLAKYCAVYSVRATAFYVLGLIGSTYDGANLLSELGWLCVRHTRHDQFPVIPDETYPSVYDSLGFLTSPDRRHYDTETSEHSDHTDQSMAESLHSDITRHLNKVGSLLTEPDLKSHDVVDKGAYERSTDKRKSHTLPTQGCSHDRPMLSESRTVDILRDSSFDRPGHRENRLVIGRMNSLEHAHEGRVRNTSESSTSGVSSCDSFLGKYAIPDRVLTLSPIPSSSSLYGMKSSSSSQRHRISELQRRTSTSSFIGPDVASSPPSQLDITGYATLKSLNRHRRPHLSESAATGSTELDDLSWLLADTGRRSKPFSSLRDRAKSTRERMTKLSLLEYDWKPLSSSDQPRTLPAARAPPPAPGRPPPAHHTPAYIGICLPERLADLFPRENEAKEDEVEFKSVRRVRVASLLVDSSTSTDNRSRATPDSQKLTSYKEIASFSGIRNDAALNSTLAHQTKERTGKTIASVMEESENVATGSGKEKEEEVKDQNKMEDNSLSMVTSRSSKWKWKHAAAECLACVRTRPPSSHELREAFFAPPNDNSPPSSPTAEHSPRQEILQQVHYMSNPIYLRQTRSNLISLKQRHPDVFRSPCVYSDVSAMLSRDTYLLCARRFLQELFLDANFTCFAPDLAALRARHDIALDQ